MELATAQYAGSGQPTAVAVLTIQARLEQLEAALRDAHGKLNEMNAPIHEQEGKSPEPRVAGIDSAVSECDSLAYSLNWRLARMSEALGQL